MITITFLSRYIINVNLNIFVFRSVFDITEGGSKPKSLNSSKSFDEKHFEVDHSFLFLVWDYYSGMLLLMGRVINPLEEA